MGLLKHILLPLFGAIHVLSVYACLDLNRWGSMVGFPVTDDADFGSTRQLHMLGVLRGFNAAMAILCFLSIFGHDSSAQARGMVILSELLFYTFVTLDAYQLGMEGYAIPGAHALAALLGVVVHAMEPGLFTKDKTKSKES